MFGSRSFTSQVLDDTLPADKARMGHVQGSNDLADLVQLFSNHFGVLLPLLDLLNHKPGAKVEWQARCSFVGLQVLETYNSGQELYNNYGPRDNEGLLLAYGFTIPNNPFDHVVISIKPPPGSPLAIARTWKPDPRSDPERRCFIFDRQHPSSTSAKTVESSIFSFDLLDSISVLCANERELQTMLARRQTLMSYCLGEKPKFEDGRLILSTLRQLLRDCSARAFRLKATDPARFTPAMSPMNPKQRNAKVYRESQLSIVETAVAVCSFLLRSATSEKTDEKIISELRPELSPSVLGNLESLLRHDRLTHPFELLTPTALYEMLPSEMSTALRECFSALAVHFPGGTADVSEDFNKSRFAVTLAAVYGDYLHGVKLSGRITAWLEQLVEWYPPDHESWAYVPASGPYSPGEEPPLELMRLLAARAALSPTTSPASHLKRWLRPERICWGWNVMEEEIVSVPRSILSPADQVDSSDARQEPSSTLIYWRRY